MDRVDTLRHEDKLLSRTVVDRWQKPKKVQLITATRGNTASEQISDAIKKPDSITRLIRSYSRIEIHWDESDATKARELVKPPVTLLESFMNLAEANDDRIRDFASRYGGLGVYCVLDQPGPNYRTVEFCDVWRYFAKTIKSLLSIATTASGKDVGTTEEWNSIHNFPAIMRHITLTIREGISDRLSPEPYEGEEGWTTVAHFVKKSGTYENRAMWRRLLNVLLSLGRVRPWVLWAGAHNEGRTRLVYGTPSLLSYLALQVCLLAVGQSEFFVCSVCRSEYVPMRVPKAGQKNYCPECRKNGAASRLGQRKRRELLRQRKGDK